MYTARQFKGMMKHYNLVHVTERNFKFSCGVQDCPKVYRNVRSYQFHLRTKHREFYNTYVGQHEHHAQDDGLDIDTSYMGIVDEEDPVVENPHPLIPPPRHNNYDIHHHVAVVMLNLREKYKVSETACSFVAQQLQTFVNLSSDQIVHEIQRELSQHNPEIDIDFQEILYQNTQPAINACQDFSSAKLLHKYVSKHMEYVEPLEMVVGEVNGVEHTIQYVPILETLKALLKHEDILAQVLQDHTSQDGILRDFCDGYVFKHNPLFQQHRNALQIELYYDDFTITNPIGTHSRKYKLSAVYFRLGNLHPKYRSQLDNIQLLALAQYHSVVAQHGLAALLKPVIDDIQILEREGIEIECQGQVHHFFGTVSFVAADNLGAHALGRFYENFSRSLKICRFCRASRVEFQGVHTDRNFQQRTKQAHDAQVRAVEQDDTLISAYGVKGSSYLNELQYYHIIDGLPSDIAHDCFEGFVPNVTMKVLSKLVEDDLFTFEQLNDGLKSFKFAAVDKGNKPGPILLTGRGGMAKLKCTQSQMWCFIRIMPFLVGHFIPEGNAHWDLFLHVLDMVECICAPAVAEGGIGYMRGVIEDCLDLFKELYPEHVTLPKMHYITHLGLLQGAGQSDLKENMSFSREYSTTLRTGRIFAKLLLSDTKGNKHFCILRTAF